MDNIIKIVIAIFICVVLVKTCQRKMEVSSWSDIKGQISSYDIEEYSDSKKYKTRDGKTKTKWEDKYRVRFTYTYIVDGVTYKGKFSVDDLDDQREINNVLRRNPNGKSVRVKYDPDNPSDNQYQT
jgi:hypothetical protein